MQVGIICSIPKARADRGLYAHLYCRTREHRQIALIPVARARSCSPIGSKRYKAKTCPRAGQLQDPLNRQPSHDAHYGTLHPRRVRLSVICHDHVAVANFLPLV